MEVWACNKKKNTYTYIYFSFWTIIAPETNINLQNKPCYACLFKMKIIMVMVKSFCTIVTCKTLCYLK